MKKYVGCRITTNVSENGETNQKIEYFYKGIEGSSRNALTNFNKLNPNWVKRITGNHIETVLKVSQTEEIKNKKLLEMVA